MDRKIAGAHLAANCLRDAAHLLYDILSHLGSVRNTQRSAPAEQLLLCMRLSCTE